MIQLLTAWTRSLTSFRGLLSDHDNMVRNIPFLRYQWVNSDVNLGGHGTGPVGPQWRSE